MIKRTSLIIKQQTMPIEKTDKQIALILNIKNEDEENIIKQINHI